MSVGVDEGVVSQATGKVNGRLVPPGSERGESAEEEVGVVEVGEDGIR